MARIQTMTLPNDEFVIIVDEVSEQEFEAWTVADLDDWKKLTGATLVVVIEHTLDVVP